MANLKIFYWQRTSPKEKTGEGGVTIFGNFKTILKRITAFYVL